jgi:hypothetical protein
MIYTSLGNAIFQEIEIYYKLFGHIQVGTYDISTHLHSDLYISNETERSCGFLSLGFALVSKHKQMWMVSDYTN